MFRMKSLIVSAAVLSAAAVVRDDKADHWAILVSGSNGYGNYRHHADTCHAYQLLVNSGVPEDHIITFLYDDVANDPSNPFPGQLFNEPTGPGVPGVDVYAGCKKSYTGNDVTADNFLAVLTGNASAVKGGSGEVLQSGPNDFVFWAFFDHGANGLVAMPVGPYLYKPDLDSALDTAYKAGMWKQFTIYMEACESGSMFEGYPTDRNIYITTAANADESSWGTYCPPDDFIDGKELGTCLGDLYSVNWLQDAERPGNMQGESLADQYRVVKEATNLSHVMQYGQTDWTDEPIGDFMGNLSVTSGSIKGDNTLRASYLVEYGRRRQLSGGIAPLPPRAASSWDSRLATISSLQVRASRQPANTALGASLRAQLRTETSRAARWDSVFRIVSTTHFGLSDTESLLARPSPALARWGEQQWACYRGGLDRVEGACGMRMGDYGLRYAKVVSMMCDGAGWEDTTTVWDTLKDACGQTA